MAHRESPDLWSVRDLLIELAPRPMISDRAEEPIRAGEPRPVYTAQGLPYESDDPELVREAQVLLLAQSDGYRTAGDPAGALHLIQEGLTLKDVESRTRERLLDFGVELAITISELDLAQRYAAELVDLTERRASPEDPDAQRDLSISLEWLGDVTRDLGDLAAAAPTTSSPWTSIGVWRSSWALRAPCETCGQGSPISPVPRRNWATPRPPRHCVRSWPPCRTGSPR